MVRPMPPSSRYLAKPMILELGEGFADPVEPARFPRHVLRFRNQAWADRVCLGTLSEAEWENHFAAFEPIPGNLEKPLALRYHGHQFRHYNPDLGDGRGFLFAQMLEADGQRRLLDLGTKGSGQTPYSRNGDGRLTLKGAVREALATEMLESLGVDTSKTFSVFETGERLVRYDEPSPTRSAVLVRLSHSHVRFGTFQRLSFHGEKDKISRLIEFCFRNYFPELTDRTPGAFLREITTRSARLCASWMVAGFVHGVLNTDNMNITGESFDYGPYRFLPKYDVEFTAAYFDETGLYAYGRQPESVLWNLEQLALALSSVCEREEMIAALQTYSDIFNAAVLEKFLDRLGVAPRGLETDGLLFASALNLLLAGQMPYAQFFHDWYGGEASRERAGKSPSAAEYSGEAFTEFSQSVKEYEPSARARQALATEYFRRSRPCDLLIDEIESIWDLIAIHDDWSAFEAKIADIRNMGAIHGRR